MTLYGGKTLEQLEALANAKPTRYSYGLDPVDCEQLTISLAAIPALIARIRELESRLDECGIPNHLGHQEDGDIMP